MEYSDRTIACIDCQAEFVHSATDQQRYAERGFDNEPKRCPQCRAKRKGTAGGRSSGGFGGGGSRGGASREMFTATCAECGAETQVPFKPTEGRPVYCRTCYQTHRR